MAHQDYVARPRATKNKKNPYKPKGKKAPQKTGVSPVISALLIFIILAAAGFGLYFMSSNASDVEVTEIELSKPKTKPQVVEDDLPEPPKEQWSYVEGLKNKEVQVDSYEVKEKGPYQMQCASFRNEKDAQILKAKIAFTGLSSTIRKAQGSNGVWYKVVLGPYERKRQAEKARHKLRNSKINGCQIWLWT